MGATRKKISVESTSLKAVTIGPEATAGIDAETVEKKWRERT